VSDQAHLSSPGVSPGLAYHAPPVSIPAGAGGVGHWPAAAACVPTYLLLLPPDVKRGMNGTLV